MYIKSKFKVILRPYFYAFLEWRSKLLSQLQRILVYKVLKKTYFDEIDFFETIATQQYADSEYLSKKIRMKIHQIDKVLLFEKKYNRENVVNSVKEFIDGLDIQCSSDHSTIEWANTIIDEYHSESRSVGEKSILPDNAMETLQKLIFDRRSIRSFTDDEINEDKIKEILNAGLWAPTGCNRQPIEYLIVKNSEDVRFCQKLAGENNAFPRKAAFNIVVMIDPRCYALPAQRHMSYLEGGAAIQNILLSIHALGYGACWLFWAKQDNDFNKHFKLFPWLLPIGMISVGVVEKYPAVVPVRKSVDDCTYFA